MLNKIYNILYLATVGFFSASVALGGVLFIFIVTHFLDYCFFDNAIYNFIGNLF